ncbi:hypothetical protein HRbin01_00646 [archaeon HR01]|nr:hypothetical protein HRbin01_00646 [archaeon HR01]
MVAWLGVLRLLTLLTLLSVAAVFMAIYLHPLHLAIVGGLSAILFLLLRGGGGASEARQKDIYYEMREENGLLHLIIQARGLVSVEVVGNTVKIVGGGKREFVKLPWSGILKNMKIVNNVVTAVISPINPRSH